MPDGVNYAFILFCDYYNKVALLQNMDSYVVIPEGDKSEERRHLHVAVPTTPYIVDERRTIQHILPSKAMLRDLSYSSVLHINITTKHFSRNDHGENDLLEERSYTKIAIARIPMMVGSFKCNLHNMSPTERHQSGHCDNDPGGYFIIKGKERVLVAQDKSCFKDKYMLFM